MMPNSPKYIVFYDSYCGLCHFFVKWVLKLDHKKLIQFAPIGGVNYQQLIPKNFKEIDSVLFFQNGEIFIKSLAVLHILRVLDRIYLLQWLIFLFPQFISDFIYDRIARYRPKKDCEYIFHDDRFLK